MKIVQAIPSMNIGGAERVVLNMARLLQQNGHQIMVASSGGVLLDELDTINTNHVEAKFLFKRDAVSISKSINFLKQQFEVWKPDIIHAHSFISLVQSWLAAKKISHYSPKMIFTIHGLEKDWSWPLIKHFSPKAADKIVTVSPYHYHMLIEWGLSKKLVIYIPNGIEDYQYEERDKINKKARSELGLPQDAIVVGSACRLVERKGVHFLLESLAQVDESIYALIVGDGPELERLKRLADKLGISERVIFTGYRMDVPILMRVFDIFCSISEWEAFPIVILEAMEAQTPIVCFQWDGADEILSDTAKLVPIANVSMLAETINQLAFDPHQRKKLGCDGFLRFKEKYTLNGVIKNLENIYFDLMEI